MQGVGASNHEPAREEFAAQALESLDALYAAALRLTRARDAADDLIQETYLRAFRFASRFKAGTNLRAWLFTILYNTHRNARRDAGRDPVDVDTEAVEQSAGPSTELRSPDEALMQGALSEDVRTALDALPDVYRQAVWLRDVEDLSYAEISEILDVPPGTVMSRIARGRRQLFERLRRGRERAKPNDRP